ncbi:I66 family serine proteinase inhibitor [Catenulispora rubra]|uniref:I66 family serine proteinase inhibitor n=1 Tax=Catenulispora rubra TaxID=280293 RepID=UPI0018924671|nr:I66 family serine proteinase inhibitor [Catenulispora rubra]
MANGPLVHISIRGADVAIINGQVYASIIAPPNATTWIASSADDGTIQFTDQAGGLVLGAPSLDPGTQAVVAPVDAGLAVSSWTLTRYSDDAEDDASPIKDASEITSGYYAIQEPGTGEFLFRNQIEDRSLMPKRVALQPSGADQGPLVIQVVG